MLPATQACGSLMGIPPVEDKFCSLHARNPLASSRSSMRWVTSSSFSCARRQNTRWHVVTSSGIPLMFTYVTLTIREIGFQNHNCTFLRSDSGYGLFQSCGVPTRITRYQSCIPIHRGQDRSTTRSDIPSISGLYVQGRTIVYYSSPAITSSSLTVFLSNDATVVVSWFAVQRVKIFSCRRKSLQRRYLQCVTPYSIDTAPSRNGGPRGCQERRMLSRELTNLSRSVSGYALINSLIFPFTVQPNIIANQWSSDGIDILGDCP